MNITDFVRKNKYNEPGKGLYVKESLLSDGSRLPLLSYRLLDETEICGHAFTTRLGGVSRGDCASLNLSFSRGDREEDVYTNYDRLAEALGIQASDIVCSDQTHTTHVIRVGREDRGNGITRPRPYTDVDGLVTDRSGVVLATFYADCVPLYFVDPVHRAIGLSHSGWKGTVGRMGRQTLLKMKEEFSTEPEDVICAIGPSICQDCYEVSADVAERFAAAFMGHEDEILLPGAVGKYQLDLWAANRLLLLEAGIRPEHLAMPDVCTCCNPSLLFSHRASKGKRGNLAALLYLKEEG